MDLAEEEAVEEMRTEPAEMRTEPEPSRETKRSMVKLDIGGTRFTTTLATLKRIPKCVFAQNTGIISACENGKIPFIDRDPALFPYILNFMRDPSPESFVVPDSDHDRRRLLEEAKYYQLPLLAQLLKVRAMPPGESLTTVNDAKPALARYLHVCFERNLTFREEVIVSATYMVNGLEIMKDGAGWFRKGANLVEAEDAFRQEISKALEKYNGFGYDVKHYGSNIHSTVLHSTTTREKVTNEYIQTLVVTVMMERVRM